MALILQDGKVAANFGANMISFSTESEFNTWYNGLNNPLEDFKKFIIIKEYEPVESAGLISITINKENFGLHKVVSSFYLT